MTPKAGVKLEAVKLERYCRENISERAAIPKKIHIIDPMPITAVGKIFLTQLPAGEFERLTAADSGRFIDMQGTDVPW